GRRRAREKRPHWRGAQRASGSGDHAVIRFDTIRTRILGGLAALALIVVCIALFSAYALGTVRRLEAAQLESVRRAAEVSNGIVASVFQEIDAAQLYLEGKSPSARADFSEA